MLKIRVAGPEDLEAVVQMMNGGASSQRVHLESGEIDTYRPAFLAIQQAADTDIYVGELDEGEPVATFQLSFLIGLAFNGKPRGRLKACIPALTCAARGLVRRCFHMQLSWRVKRAAVWCSSHPIKSVPMRTAFMRATDLCRHTKASSWFSNC